MYLVLKKCVFPIVHDLNNVSCKINSTLITSQCKHSTIACLVDVQKVKSTKLENADETQGKCPRVEENNSKLDEICLAAEGGELGSILSLQNGVMEKDSEVCSAYETENKLDVDVDSSSEQVQSLNKTLQQEEIRRNLRWIRWIEYSNYAKSLIMSNKWESLQNEFVTVVTYNVLSQVLLERHRYLYQKNDETSLKWDTRSQVLLREFEEFNADILCLQEVDSSLLNSYYNYNLNRMGYQGIYKQRTNDKVDGCAIYFKKDKFNLLKHTTVELFKEAVNLLDRDNIGIILKLSLKSNPELEFVVATTHLLYNPKRGDIKLAQTQLMLAEIEKLAYRKHNFLTRQPEYLPIIFTGDMNYSPDNGVYQLVTKSFLEYEGMSSEKLLPINKGRTLNKTLLPPKIGVTDSCQYASSLRNREGFKEISYSTGALGHHLNLESVYNHVKGNLPEATTNQNAWVTVDYIFYSQLWDDNLKIRTDGNLKPISRLTLPNAQEAEVYLKYLPNLACGSDHLPLMATFHLNKES